MYYNINIKGSNYNIVESTTRQTRDSSAETNRKINLILAGGYTYSPTSIDKFASLSNEERCTILREIPSIIKDNDYNKTVATVSKYLPGFIVNSLFTPVTNTSVDRVCVDRGVELTSVTNTPVEKVPESRTARADRILQRALESPTIRKLYNDVCATDTGSKEPWTIEFVSDLAFPAMCVSNARVIQLTESLTDDEALCCLIFELANALQTPAFNEVSKKAAEGEIDADEYAELYERIEFESARMHHELVSNAINAEKMDWGDKMDIYQEIVADDWDTHWSQIKTSDHTQHYRNVFQHHYGHIRKEESTPPVTPSIVDPYEDL